MPRRSKSQRKTSQPKSKRREPAQNGFSAWLVSTSRPGTDLSLLLAKVRGAQIRRLHFR